MNSSKPQITADLQAMLFDFDGTLAPNLDLPDMRRQIIELTLAYAVPEHVFRDRYIVEIIDAATLTAEGDAMTVQAPTPLQDLFSRRFAALEDWEKSMIICSLQRVASMMNAENIDASPMLHVGSADEPVQTN